MHEKTPESREPRNLLSGVLLRKNRPNPNPTQGVYSTSCRFGPGCRISPHVSSCVSLSRSPQSSNRKAKQPDWLLPEEPIYCPTSPIFPGCALRRCRTRKCSTALILFGKLPATALRPRAYGRRVVRGSHGERFFPPWAFLEFTNPRQIGTVNLP